MAGLAIHRRVTTLYAGSVNERTLEGHTLTLFAQILKPGAAHPATALLLAVLVGACSGGSSSVPPDSIPSPPPVPNPSPNPSPDSTRPSTPSGLSANAASSTRINLSWSASTDNVGVTGYRVYRGSTVLASVSTTSFSDSGVAPATTYTYSVEAYDAAGNTSARSASVTISTPASPPPPSSDTTAPSIPANVAANAVSPSQVNLSWSASTDNVGVSGYRIFRGTSALGSVTVTSFSDTGVAPSSSYNYTVEAFDAAGNPSARSTPVTVTTPAAQGNVLYGNPSNYLGLVRSLKPGDTLQLEAGNYDIAGEVPGLPLFDINGTPSQPIVITGPASGARAVLLGRSTHNTVRLSNASYIVIKNLDIDGRNLGAAGIKAQGPSHHITLENLNIRGVGSNQQVVGISTNGAPTWNWIIRRCTITQAGTGMYLGDSDGSNPFIAGIIEHNLIVDTIGYNIEIKHQNVRPSLAGMPSGQSVTVIRHNVFKKGSNSSTGGMARPNLLVGHFPPSGVGVSDVYEIYGNFFFENATEYLFQGEGNIAFHHNVMVNRSGSAMTIQPHNDVPKSIRVFNNTIVASGTGIRVTGGSPSFQQKVIGNAVFAATPISAADQSNNVVDSFANAGNYLNNPGGNLGQLDLYPKVGTLQGAAIDASTFNTYADWDKDFNGAPRNAAFRGAYFGEGSNPGWLPKLEIKP